MKKLVFLSVLIGFCFSCSTFKTESIYKGYANKGKHARGLDCENDKVVVSGYQGAYAQFDLINFKWILKDSIQGIEDFRDVEIINDSTFIVINSGINGDIWKVSRNVKTKVFHQNDMFLDGVDFDSTGQYGYIYGDPINNNFTVLKSIDFGNSWQKIAGSTLPQPLVGEAGFAASGTGIICLSQNVVVFVTGSGEKSRLIKSIDGGKTWRDFETPMKSGGSYGIYSACFNDEQNGVIVGGSYIDSTYNDSICFIKTNSNAEWQNISKGLPGYMSCVTMNKDMSLIVVTGRNGTYFTTDKGQNWKKLFGTPYYSCKVTDNYIILSGKNGSFEVLSYKF